MISKTVRWGLPLLLAAAATLPAGPASAEPPPPRPGAALVPGVPLAPPHPWQLDTPDQALPPRVHDPSAAEDAHEPAPAVDELIEFVPPSEVVTKAAAARCTTRSGPHQRQVERWLKLTVDGKQSAKDCRAIRE